MGKILKRTICHFTSKFFIITSAEINTAKRIIFPKDFTQKMKRLLYNQICQFYMVLELSVNVGRLCFFSEVRLSRQKTSMVFDCPF